MVSRPRLGTRSSRGKLPSLTEIDTSTWVEVDVDALTDDRRTRFLARRLAIRVYLAGASDEELRAATGNSRANVYRLISRRCLIQHEDGQLYGWRGALPYLRVVPYVRKAKPVARESGGGSVGALRWLFASPEGRTLEQHFRDQILEKPAGLKGHCKSKQMLFRWLIGELRILGYERRGEWPFTVERMGYVTIGKFIDQVLAEHPERRQVILGGPDAVRKAKAGDGTERPALRLFQRVECDAHKLDVRMVVMIPSPHGGHEARKIHRLWVIVIVEVCTRAVLGYHLSLRRECAAEDVLRAVKQALSVWSPRHIQFSESAYASEAGLPSSRSETFVGACWDEFSVDGALANICERVERPMREIVGATVLKPQDPASFTCRRSKDDRPYIEAFFGRLTHGSLHRLSTSTGHNPAAKRGTDPDAAAEATQFQLEYAEELLDTIIANYNATPHTGLGYRSPLAQLDFLASTPGNTLRHADASEVRRMVGIRKLCTLLGGAESGRRPHFNFANARYSAEWLVARPDLLGKLFWLQIENEDDARWATVSTQEGLFLGAVRAAPPWHLSPHTLYMREAIRALNKRRMVHLSNHCDAVEELLRFSEAQENNKLPPHPAYLEARRVLRKHADALAEQPILAGQVSTNPDPQSGEPPEAKQGAAQQAPLEAVSQPKAEQSARRLPPMKPAKTW